MAKKMTRDEMLSCWGYDVTHHGVPMEERGVAWVQPKNGGGWRDYWRWKLFINQGWREASVVEASGIRFLMEYEMPNGRTYLVEVSVARDGQFDPFFKSINRKNPPARWREAIAELVDSEG